MPYCFFGQPLYMTLLIVILTQNFHAETKILVAYLELDKRLCLTSWWLVGPLCLSKKLVKIQLNPALTDFRRQKFSSVMNGLLLLPIKEIKEINLKGPWICICYRRNSVGGGSVRAGFNCISVYYYPWQMRFNGPLGRSLRSFVRATHSLGSASLRLLAPFTGSLTPSLDN